MALPWIPFWGVALTFKVSAPLAGKPSRSMSEARIGCFESMAIDGGPTQPHRGVYTYGTLVDFGPRFDAVRKPGTRYRTPGRDSPRLRRASVGHAHASTHCITSPIAPRAPLPEREMPPRCTQYTRRYAVVIDIFTRLPFPLIIINYAIDGLSRVHGWEAEKGKTFPSSQ